jgi:hypothetical protein
VRGGLAVVLAVLANVVLVVGVDALGIASDVALLAIDPTATALSVVALMPMHVIVAAVPVWVLLYWGAER